MRPWCHTNQGVAAAMPQVTRCCVCYCAHRNAAAHVVHAVVMTAACHYAA